MSCYIEDEVDYEIFELTEKNCNSSTDELNVILTSCSQDPLGDITANKNVASKKAESVFQKSKSRSNATAIAKKHELKTDAKKGDVKNGVHYYQQQPSYTAPDRIYATPHFKGQKKHKDSKYASGIYVDRRARDEVLDKQRREEEESWRRRQQESVSKRKHTDGPSSEAKRQHTDAPTNERKRSHNDRRPLHDSNRRASQSNYRKQEETNCKAPLKPPITARLQRREQASPLSKKVENGKSSELVISNLNENTTFSDIKKLVDEINTVAKITYRNGEPTSTLLFGSIDTAVMFRRKYNRSKMGDSHVNIAFKK